jgi:hypothetical protein
MAQLAFVPPAVAATSTNIAEVSGFTTAIYYEGPLGFLQGSATMSAVFLARLKHAFNGGGGVEVMGGCFRGAVGGGWQLGKDTTRFKQYYSDALPNKRENATEGDFSQPSFTTDFSSGTHVLIGMTSDGTDVKMFINGRRQSTMTMANPGFTAEATTYKWGRNAFGAFDAFSGAICGAALDESNTWTEDQMFDYWLAVKDGLDVVDGGLNWEHRWSLNGVAAGAAPATISDVGSGTARDLTIVGALTVAEHRYDWYRY